MSASQRYSSERQTHDLLAALTKVVGELETSQAELDIPNLSSERRQDLYYVILTDMGRLANLLHLAESHAIGHLQDRTREHIRETLDYVRQRATSIGVEIALSRIRALRRQAERSTKGRMHPLGRSFRLREDLNDAVSLLHNFGLSLPQEHMEDLLDSAASINSLIRKDREITWLQPLAEEQEDSCPLIDIQELVARVAISEQGHAHQA